MIRSYTYAGKMIGMPVSCSAILLYYNKTMFKEVGIAKAPATIAEMAEAIKKLMIVKGKNVERYGLNVAVRRYQLANFIGGQGAFNFFGDNEGGRLAPMTKVTLRRRHVARFPDRMGESRKGPGGYKATEDDINEEFSLQLFGMAIMSSARIGKISSLVGNKFEWGAAPLPKVNAQDKGGIAVGGSLRDYVRPG